MAKKKRRRRAIVASPKRYTDGTILTLLGQDMVLCFQPNTLDRFDWIRGQVILNDGQNDEQLAKHKVLILMRVHLMRIIHEMVASKASFYGVTYNRITIKNIKSRWGSCSSLGNLNFNLQLIGAPREIIEYIVVHEVCHLIHLNHSNAFWDAVALQVPDWREKRHWLKIHGASLNLDWVIPNPQKL